MRIVIDMQGAQTASRFRGIGIYTLGFVQAIVRNCGEHEVILVLSGLLPESIQVIRDIFHKLLPQENIRVWHAPGPLKETESGNEIRRSVANLLREAFLTSLQPDIIHISSLFEGYGDDAFVSISRGPHRTPVSVTLYDLIPLLNKEYYLKPNPAYEKYYNQKIDSLKQADLYLAISEYTRQEAISTLGFCQDQVVSVSTAVDVEFWRPLKIDGNDEARIRRKFGINSAFLLHTGGADERKNLARLIEAYALLPLELRNDCQLVLAGKMPEATTLQLKKYARRVGLGQGELIFTGFVSVDDLRSLYNLCKLYVFPSWQEGFGLPALEAMASGAPVIGANAASLPDVIGLAEALFDPFDVNSIARKLIQALEDSSFREKLRIHSLSQAKKFSWDETATSAIKAWEELVLRCGSSSSYIAESFAYNQLLVSLAKPLARATKPELLSVSHCLAQNEISGIQRQLFVDVSELCQHDSATGVQRVVRSYLKWLLHAPPDGFRVEPVFATHVHGYHYARQFTQQFLGLEIQKTVDPPIRWQRGDLFFGLDMQHYVQLEQADFYNQLKRDGVVVKFLVYDLLPIRFASQFKQSTFKELHERWLSMIAATDGAICISKSTADDYELWIKQASVPTSSTFKISWLHIGADLSGSNPSRGIPEDARDVIASLRQRPTFLCVSTLEPRKCQEQILSAIEQLWQSGIDINLVLVGQQGWKTESLVSRLVAHKEQGHRLFWLPGISDEYLDLIYSSSTCLVAASLNEGFGLSLIEAAKHRIPIIVRDIPVFREVAGEHATYFHGHGAGDLASIIANWLRAFNTGTYPKSQDMPWLTWDQSANHLKELLTQYNYPKRQLLVDVSELAQRDARTGIQRVVRNILREWLRNPPKGYRVEPIYASVEHGYRYARRFVQDYFGTDQGPFIDDPIVFAPGDIFLGLDLAPAVVPTHQRFYQHLQRNGVSVKFVVYDLLPLVSEYFEPAHADACSRWLEVVASSDGAYCISNSVADEFADWISKNSFCNTGCSFTIDWFHLGADNYEALQSAIASRDNLLLDFDRFKDRLSFLMVSTLAPHKGHSQVLEAFEQLWDRGHDINLIIVGKEGWLVKNLVEKIRNHAEFGHRLFWFEDVTDAMLEELYAASTCLIAASYGEGFGLPLIEAAQRGLPILARDIPVFREVASEHAYYFAAETPDQLSMVISDWLDLYQRGLHPTSISMPWLSWSESAIQLLSMLAN